MKGMLTLYFLTIAIITANIAYAQNGHWQWAVTAQDAGAAETRKLATDDAGNVYATGSFEGSIQLGNHFFTSKGRTDAWLAKYDTDGRVVWARATGSTDIDESIGVTTDANGNVYITGQYASTLYVSHTDSLLQFDSNDEYPYSDIFIIKYSSDGELVWNRSIGSKYGEYATDIQADSKGYIYSTGIIASKGGSPAPDSVHVYFNQDSLTAYDGSDAYVARYDTNGNITLLKTIGRRYGSEHVSSIAVDKTGSMYIGGGFSRMLTIDNLTMISAEQGFVSGDIFVAKLDSTGKAIWASNASPQKTTGGISPGITYPPYISLVNDALYIAGSFWDCDVYFPGLVPAKINAVAEKAYLARCHSISGSFEWAQSLGQTSLDGARCLATDKEENAYILSVWNQNFRLGKYDKTGASVYEEYAQGGAWPMGICIDKKDDIYVAGWVNNSITFGTHNILPANNQNIFLAKFKSYPTVITGAQQLREQVNAYPNPFTNELKITNGQKGACITITDVMGRRVYTSTMQSTSVTLQLNTIPAGTYFISVEGAGYTAGSTLIKL